MTDTALNVPFEASEIMHIICDELKTRMGTLSPLQGGKEYSWFLVEFQVHIRLRRAGEEMAVAKDTLAWGKVEKGELPRGSDIDTVRRELVTADEISQFESKDPNDERMDRDMPMTV